MKGVDEIMAKRTKILALLCSMYVVAALPVGCGADGSIPGAGTGAEVDGAQVPMSTSAAQPTPSPSTSAAVATETSTKANEVTWPNAEQRLLEDIVAKVLVSEGAALAVMIDGDGNALEATNGTGDNGAVPTSRDLFRVGSITKVFTALATLTLVEEGVVERDAEASAYLSRVEVPEGVTVRDLLQHTSGILDVVAPNVLFERPDRVWSPEEILDEWRAPGTLETGAGFTYASSNYFLLGVLLEEVTGQSFHEVVRERLIGPLELADTYLAHHEDGGTPFDPYAPRDVENYDYTSIATGAWSAGAMVSSAPDLHRLFSALFDGQVISEDLL